MINWYAWPVAIGGAVAVVLFVYGNQWKSFKALLRFLATFLLILLFFNPNWNSEKVFQRKSVIHVFTDISESTKIESKGVLNDFKNKLKKLFGEEIVLKEYFFGSELIESPNDSIEFSTRLDRVTDFIQRESNQCEGSLIISDGIANRGGNPLKYQSSKPVFILGTGDPNSYPDASILSLNHNETVFNGNEFEVEVALQTELLEGKSVIIDFFQDGFLKKTISIIPQTSFDVQRLNFIGKADKKGLSELEVKVRLLDEKEKNYFNNNQSSKIEIVSQKKQIAVLYQTVHPDLGSIRSALVGIEQFELIECKKLSDLLIKPKGVIAFNIDNGLYKELLNSGLPFWLFSNNSSQLANEITNSYRVSSINGQPVTPEVNDEFGLFSVEKLPFPMKSVDCPLVKLNIPKEKIQLFQQWNRVNTNLPLCYADDIDGRKLYFAGFGIWKWRIQELKQTGESRWFDQWVRSNVEWLSNQNSKTKNIEWIFNKRSWRVGEQRKFKFALMDAALKRVENADLQCTIIDPQGNERKLGVASNLGMFTGVIRPVTSGTHVLKVNLKKSIPGVLSKEFTQEFSVDTFSIEMKNTKANHSLLAVIAANSKGEFYRSDLGGIDSIMQKLQLREINKPRLEILRSRIFATEEALFLYIIVLLFGLEWFLRKWQGRI